MSLVWGDGASIGLTLNSDLDVILTAHRYDPKMTFTAILLIITLTITPPQLLSPAVSHTHSLTHSLTHS